MPLAVAVVGEHAVGVLHLLRDACGELTVLLLPLGSAAVQKPPFTGLYNSVFGRPNHLEFGMAGEEFHHRPLVLGRRECAGGVDQVPARAEHPCGLLQNLSLSRGAQSHVLGTPHGHRVGFLAEHPLPRAGGVHHDPVKEGGELYRQLGGCGVGDDAVPHPHALYVLGQDPRTGGVDLVGDQETLTAQSGGQLGGLSPGGGAEVKHLFPRLGGTQRPGEHGAGLLDVVSPRLVKGVLAGAGLPVGGIVKAVFLPRDRLPHKGRGLPQLISGQLQGIQPQGRVSVLGVGLAEGLKISPQHDPHPLDKPAGEGQPFNMALDVFVIHLYVLVS